MNGQPAVFRRPEQKQSRVLILGASTRAAAHSAVRAGLRPICADCFLDDDLREVAEVHPIDCYPHDFSKISSLVEHAPWMYTGALENEPALIASISTNRPLWGNDTKALAVIRDPFAVFEILRAADLPVPEVLDAAHPPPADGRWLLKPLKSAAGRGIQVWNSSASHASTLREPHYFQQFVAGNSYSAVFIAKQDGCALVGITRQLVGSEWLNARQYAYSGSIGPLVLSERLTLQIEQIGSRLARSAVLEGLFGIDFVTSDRCVRPTEINPRYTASVEVIERAWGISLLDRHRRACEKNAASPVELQNDGRPSPIRAIPDIVVGKAILYADQSLTVRDLNVFLAAQRVESKFLLADRPAPGTCVEAGHPICTILVEAKSEKDALHVLRQRAAELLEYLKQVTL